MQEHIDSQVVLSNRSDVWGCACLFRLSNTSRQGWAKHGNVSMETSEVALGLEISQYTHTSADLTPLKLTG